MKDEKQYKCPYIDCDYQGAIKDFVKKEQVHYHYSGSWCPKCKRSVELTDKGELVAF